MSYRSTFTRLLCLALAGTISGCAALSLPPPQASADGVVVQEEGHPVVAPEGFVVEGVAPAVWHAMEAVDQQAWLDSSVQQAHAMIARSSCGDLWRAHQRCSAEVKGTYHLMQPTEFRVVAQCPQTRSSDVYWFVGGEGMNGPELSNAKPVCSDRELAVYYGHISMVVQNTYR